MVPGMVAADRRDRSESLDEISERAQPDHQNAPPTLAAAPGHLLESGKHRGMCRDIGAADCGLKRLCGRLRQKFGICRTSL